jgi:hypothetical protein
MSSVVVSGDTSGSVTLQAPAVAGSVVVTLPAATGTMSLTSQAVRQVVWSMPTSLASGTTLLPCDDTIPQNTEGDQYLSLAITPQSATSTLLIDVMLFGGVNTIATWSAALFQDSTANALAASCVSSPNSGYFQVASLSYKMTSGTTSATTFKVRAGPATGGQTLYINGNSNTGTRFFGGVAGSFIRIMEIGN